MRKNQTEAFVNKPWSQSIGFAHAVIAAYEAKNGITGEQT